MMSPSVVLFKDRMMNDGRGHSLQSRYLFIKSQIPGSGLRSCDFFEPIISILDANVIESFLEFIKRNRKIAGLTPI